VTRSIVASVLLIALTDVALQLDNALAISSSPAACRRRTDCQSSRWSAAGGRLPSPFTLIGSNPSIDRLVEAGGRAGACSHWIQAGV